MYKINPSYEEMIMRGGQAAGLFLLKQQLKEETELNQSSESQNKSED